MWFLLCQGSLGCACSTLDHCSSYYHLQGALKLCDALLEKYPKSQLLLGLKAYTLHRLGRQVEAIKVSSAACDSAWQCVAWPMKLT